MASAADSFTPQFGGRQDTQVRLVTIAENPVSGEKTRYQHHTYMFREPKTLGRIPALLAERFPDGVPIEIYAGSSGLDAVSLGILLMAGLGKEQASKYKITTSDLFPKLSTRTQRGVVGLIPWGKKGNAFDRIKKHQLGPIEKDYSVAVKLEDYIDPEPLADHPSRKHFRINNEDSVKHCNTSRDEWAKKADAETLHRIRPDAWETIRHMLRFRQQPVNAVDELAKPLPVSRRNKPRMIFLRNMVYMLNPDDVNRLHTALKDNAPKGSVLVLGDSESWLKGETSYDYDAASFIGQLKTDGWQELPGETPLEEFLVEKDHEKAPKIFVKSN